MKLTGSRLSNSRRNDIEGFEGLKLDVLKDKAFGLHPGGTQNATLFFGGLLCDTSGFLGYKGSANSRPKAT